MLSKRVKGEVIIVMAGAVLLTGVAVSSDKPKTEDRHAAQTVEQTAEAYHATAGVTVAFEESHAYDTTSTAGISVAFADINHVQVVSMDTALVAAAQEEPETLDFSIAGYTNLGIAILSGDSNLNVRGSASTDGEILGKMTNHNACEIIGTEGEWLQITSGDLTGYVKGDYIVTGQAAYDIAKQEIATYAIVQTDSLRVRAEASTDSAVLGKVGKERELKMLSVSDGWIQVEYSDRIGYISADYAVLEEKLTTAKTLEQLRYGSAVSSVRQDLVNYACQFIGNRYVWGGTSLTNGVDCSGFTMRVYERYGVYLPHYSASQPAYGTKIKASEAKPGDLFFYSGCGTRIDHVAIYIGDGQIVHASGRKTGIKISNAFYQSPVCVVRYLDD